MTTAQVKALTTDQLGTLNSDEIVALTTAQVAALTTAQVAGLTTAQMGGLTTAQVRALTTAQIKALETADLAALSTQAVAGLTTAQIASITSAQAVGLTTAEISALSMTQVAAFRGETIGAMSTAQVNALAAVSPIILDLNGDGVSTLSVAQGVSFDLAATGAVRQTGWVAPTDGLLVRDLNQDGVINDGRELFGSATQVDGRAAGDGFNALRALDSDADGRLTAADAAFTELAIWKDADQDGVTDAGELSSLSDNGVVALNLSAQSSTAMDNGNLLGLVSSYESADGGTHDMVDVWFRQGDPDALRNSVTELTQSLGSYLETDAVESGASASLSPTASANQGSPALAMAVQLETYYSLQAVTGANPVAQGASAVNSLLSGGVSNPSATTLLASSDGIKTK